MAEDFGGLTQAISQRALKVYWLIDNSGSMYGKKMATVNQAIKDCIDPMRDANKENVEIKMLVRAVTFETTAKWHVAQETDINDFKWTDVVTGGLTATGAALRLVAEEMRFEKMGERALPPLIILMSDGGATDDYDGGLSALTSHRWGRKAVRVAIAIGDDANIGELTKFCSHPDEAPPLVAKNATDLVDYIKWASVGVSQTVSTSVGTNAGGAASVNANANKAFTMPPLPKKQTMIGGSDDDDDDVF
ncbi:hypothetical protein AGMMS49975_24980 [Clostridia bacterium]|nr:hypothetical protein AGMMS49975_24980 [Clostridia bacterium]